MMKRLITLLLMATCIAGCGLLSRPPKGELTYCSYAQTGAAGLGKDYCELIADEGKDPIIVVVLDEGNRFGDPEIRRTFEVDRSVVQDLAKLLVDNKVYRLDGYNLEEPISGGHSYRIYQEYSSGEHVDARWYGHGVKESALRAYAIIEHFFAPWREQAIKENTSPVAERVSAMEELYNRVGVAIRENQAYPELRDHVIALSEYMDSGQWKEDFEADERGELPPNLPRGVLSEDGLYNLLQDPALAKLLK